MIENSLGQSFELVCEGGQLKLPIRPILLGGDDLTLLCDGRLALDLAAASLGAFENARIEQFSQPVRACAGVAIGRTHTPVARLFQLAEELCRSAKQHVRESGSDDCGLDWHVAFQSPIESLARLRHRQYRVGEAERVLTARPYLLGNLTAPTVNTWHWLDRVVLGTGDGSFRGDEWTIRRSKVKALRDLIRSGPRDVAQAMHAWHVSAPNLRFPDGINEDGFAGGTTTLLDAIELLDLHWSLESCYVDA